MWKLWSITLQKNEILYSNLLGRKTMIKYEDIKKAELDEYQRLIIYERKKFVINEEVNTNPIISILRKNKIPVKPKYSRSSFTMGLGRLQKVVHSILWVLLLALSCFCALDSTELEHFLYVVLLFGTLIFYAVYILFIWNRKIKIEKSTIIEERLFLKNKKIQFSEVDYINKTEHEGVTCTILICKNKKKIKYCKHHTNAYLFDEIIKQQRWKIK